jgi:hypothetical protein
MLARPTIIFERLPQDQDDEADAIAPQQPQFVVAKQCFDLTLFGDSGDSDSALAHMESMLARRIEGAEKQHPLTVQQKEKLRIAGRGDIKRLLDRIEDERKQFDSLRADLRGCQRFLRGLLSLQQTYREGPFSEGSLFSKTFHRITVTSCHSPATSSTASGGTTGSP